MPVWKPEDVDAVDLTGWAILECRDGLHVAGTSAQDWHSARISSPISEIRQQEGYLETNSRSGRTYRLHGASGPNDDTRYLIDRARVIWKYEELRMLTEDEVQNKIGGTDDKTLD